MKPKSKVLAGAMKPGPAPEPMKFEYFAGEQRTKPWFDAKLGKPSASNLYRWEAVSKKDGVTPLKAREDYEKELQYERQFGVMFEKFTSSAMQEGIDWEDFARQQYTKITGRVATEVGMWHNEFFCASPDAGVEDEGLLEIKWLKDTNWTEVLRTKKPYVGNSADHWKQCQGQLFASGRKWVDYVAGNLSTKKVIIVRVYPDLEYFDKLNASLRQPLTIEPFDLTNVFDFVDVVPEGAPPTEENDFNF